MMLHQLLHYVNDRLFVYQFIVSVVVYFLIRLVQLINYRLERHSIFRNHGIPGPKPSLLDGHYRLYGKLDRNKRTIFKVEEEVARKYGKVYGVFIGDEPSVIVTDLDMLKKIFCEETKSFTERSVMFLQIPLSKSILFAKYPRWKAMRKFLSPAFSKYTMRGASHTQFIEDSIQLMLDYIDQRNVEARAGQRSAAIDIHDLMKATALHLISAIAIKLPDVEIREDEKYVKCLDKFLSGADKGVVVLSIMCPIFKPVVQFLAHHVEHNQTLAFVFKTLNKVLDEGRQRLRNRRKAGASQNNNFATLGDTPKTMHVMDSMVKLHLEGKMSREEVLANAEAILFAGYDTTSTTMAYLLWVLAKEPAIQEKLRREVLAHGIDSSYLMQVIKETMRLYPTVISFTTRVATETVQIDKWLIPQGAKVIYNAWLMSRNPEIWPEPEKFEPERFREGVELHPCAYAPFGLGDRVCLGYQLALLEIKMLTCTLLLRYRVKLISPQVLELVSYVVTLTKPREPVMLEFERL